MDTFMRDVRYALTMMRRNKGFAAAGLLTLALGIGATTAVFSVVYGVLLRPLPYPAADRLIRVWEEHPGGTPITGDRWISNRAYYAWSERPRTIDVIGGYGTNEFTVTLNDDSVRMLGAQVSPVLLAAVGATPILGRLPATAEGEEGAGHVVVLSDRLWRDAYGADGSVLGRSMTIEGEPYAIVGVLSSGFAFPDRRPRFWMPYVVPRVSTDPALSQRTSGLSAIARMAPGATIAQVEAEGTAVVRSVPVTMSTQLLFGKGGPPVVHGRPLTADVTAEVRPALLVLAAAVGCILLIACANVANLFLSRGLARQRELAVRAAIGAGRGRLARQLLTESLVFSIGGGVIGLALASGLVRLVPALAPARFPRLDDVRLDARVLAFAALATLVTALVSGLAPAFRGTRFDLAESLHGGDGAVAGGFRGLRARRLRDVLLAAEAAFTVMLLVGAALFARSFVRLTHVDAGYSVDHVLTARVQMAKGAPAGRSDQFIDRALAALRTTPGIRAAGAGTMMPLLRITAMTTFALPPDAGRGKPTQTRQMTYTVTPGYAEALGLRLREGRFFNDGDAVGGTRAMIVNDEFVRRYLSNGPVVGRQFQNLYLSDKGVVTEIVGVVGTVLKDGNDRRPEPEIYFAHAAGVSMRRILRSVNLVVRTADDPAAMTTTLRRMIRDIDHTVTIERIEPLADQLSASVAQPRFATAVLATFAVIALALASVGLYGVLAYAVSQRRRELGVRTALGASRARLVTLVLREGLGVTAIGLAIGLAGAAALTRLMQSALFGVTPLDAASFLAAPLMLVLVALAACLLPAVRAASIEPAEALRRE